MAFKTILCAVASRFAPAVLLTGLVCSLPSVARAGEPAELSYSGSVGAFYGGLPAASDSVNPYGMGLGLRLGSTLPVGLYLALSYEHFFGGEPSEVSNIYAYEREATTEQLQGWVGYELPLDGITLRPCLGLGAAYMQEQTLTTDQQGGRERSEEDAFGFVASPALQLIFPVGPASLLVEGRYSIVPEAVAEADALLVGVGFGAEI